MKRIVAIFLALVVITASVFAFAGCEYTPKWKLKDYGFVIYTDEQWAEYTYSDFAEQDGKDPMEYLPEAWRGGHTLMADCSLVEGYEKGEIFCVYLFSSVRNGKELTSLNSLEYNGGIYTIFPFFDKGDDIKSLDLIILKMEKKDMQLYEEYKDKSTGDEHIIKDAKEKSTKIIKFKLK